MQAYNDTKARYANILSYDWDNSLAAASFAIQLLGPALIVQGLDPYPVSVATNFNTKLLSMWQNSSVTCPNTTVWDNWFQVSQCGICGLDWHALLIHAARVGRFKTWKEIIAKLCSALLFWYLVFECSQLRKAVTLNASTSPLRGMVSRLHMSFCLGFYTTQCALWHSYVCASWCECLLIWLWCYRCAIQQVVLPSCLIGPASSIPWTWRSWQRYMPTYWPMRMTLQAQGNTGTVSASFENIMCEFFLLSGWFDGDWNRQSGLLFISVPRYDNPTRHIVYIWSFPVQVLGQVAVDVCSWWEPQQTELRPRIYPCMG